MIYCMCKAALTLKQHYLIITEKHTLTSSLCLIKLNKNAAALTFCNIQIEEVAVEDGLHHPSNDGNHVKESLKVEPPYPVD